MKRVSTSFIEHNGKIAIFQRSGKVRTFQHHWAGVSGGIALNETPFDCAKREIKEETGLIVGKDLTFVRSGRPLYIDNSKYQYQVFPFLFKSMPKHESDENLSKIKLPKPLPHQENLNIEIDWEHSNYKFVQTNDILKNNLGELTVPELDKTLDRVYIPEDSEFFKIFSTKIVGNKHDGASALVQTALKDVIDAWIHQEQSSSTSSSSSSKSSENNIEVLARRMKNMSWFLDQARPNMVAIGNTITQAVASTLLKFEPNLKGATPDALLTTLKEEATKLAKEQDDVCKEIGTYLAHELFFKYSILATKLNILTISQSRTVVEALKQCHKLYPSLVGNIVVSEARPAFEGVQMAERLSQISAFDKISVTTEAALMSLVYDMRIDAIVIGVDCIEQDENGNYTIVNKVGSNILKTLVNNHNIPMYILCDTMKINVAHEYRVKMKLEHGEAKDILPAHLLDSERIKVYNPIFERVPISSTDTRVKIISNVGNLELSHLNKVAKQFAENRRQLFYSPK